MTTKPELAPASAGALILATLERIDMTQAQLARATGFTPKHITALVHGRHAITPDVAMRVERGIELALAERNLSHVAGLSAVDLMHADATYRLWDWRRKGAA